MKTKRKPRKEVSWDEYKDLCDAVNHCIGELEHIRGSKLAIARMTMVEIEFSARHNAVYRLNTFNELRDVLDDVYTEIHSTS